MIELGCCAFNFGWLDLESALRLVSQMGFRYVDIGANSPTAQVNQEAAAADPARLGAEIREAARRHGLEPVELFVLTIHVDGQPVDVNHPDGALRRRLLQRFRGLCQCAAAAGMQSVLGLPGKLQPGWEAEQSWQVAAEMLTEMVAVARAEGVHFNLEAAKGSLLEHPAAALRMAQQVPGLGYTIDYGHFIGQGIAQEEVTPLFAYAPHIHGKQARPGYLKCMCHEGTVDYAAVIRELRARRWDGIIAMECIGRLLPPANEPAYQNVRVTGEAEPPTSGLLNHPAFQTVQLAYELQRILNSAG